MPSTSKRRQARASRTDQNHALPIVDSSSSTPHPPSSTLTSPSNKPLSSVAGKPSTTSPLTPTASSSSSSVFAASDPAPRMTTSAAAITSKDSKGAAVSATAVTSSSVHIREGTEQRASSAAGGQVRRRKQAVAGAGNDAPLSQVDGQSDMPTLPPEETPHPKWVLLALLSGGFAAMNGVFAKLTTSSDSPPFTSFFVGLLPFVAPTVVELVLRAIFFGLNLASNAVMWVLFTRALTSHPSTTKVSVVNTSANFALTAIMGSLVFREAVGGIGGIIGLSLLVAGCVVLGAQKEQSDRSDDGASSITVEGPLVDSPYKDDIEDLTAGEATVEELIDLQNDLKEEHDPGAILDGTEDEDDDET